MPWIPLSQGSQQLSLATRNIVNSSEGSRFTTRRVLAVGGMGELFLAEVKDDGWFFDTELLMLAQRRGLRIHEVPVDWTDDPDSRVDIIPTAWRP